MPIKNECSLLQKRIEQAKEKGCQDSSFLEGAICTNRCEFHSICKIKRVPVLIQAQSCKVIIRHECEQIAGMHCSTDLLTGWQPDEYIIGGVERDI